MPVFSAASKQRLSTCHPDLQKLFYEVVKFYDCAIIAGHRGKEDQDAAVAAGKSKLAWPKSKHNSNPSHAVDVVPYPIDWHDYRRFYHFGGFVLHTAMSLGIPIRWGGDWDSDFKFEQKFIDLPHFELK